MVIPKTDEMDGIFEHMLIGEGDSDTIKEGEDSEEAHDNQGRKD
jgi:hypothetical protein